MDRNIINNAPHKAKLFFMFMMFLWVASVSPLTGFNFGNNPILMPLYCIILSYYYNRYCKYSYKPVIIFISIFIFWLMLNSIKYHSFQGMKFIPIYSIIIAHIAFNIYDNDEFLYYFEKVLVFFASISIVTWVLVNIIGSPMVNFMRTISVISPSPPTDSYCFLTGICEHVEMGIRRNLGFTWEPGKYSCWLLLGMFVNLIRNSFIIYPVRCNKTFFLLLVSLISTMSTTGYVSFVIIILFYFMNVNSNVSKFILIILCVSIIPTILGLSFMWDKIHSLSDLDKGIGAIEYYTREGQETVCPQRFTGFYVSLQNFIHDFWLGFNKTENSFFSVVYMENKVLVESSEGILRMLSRYGIFVGLFFYVCLIKSTILLSHSYNYKGTYIFMLLFLMISFSYDFWENCILMYFYLCAFYNKYDSRYFSNLNEL